MKRFSLLFIVFFFFGFFVYSQENAISKAVKNQQVLDTINENTVSENINANTALKLKGNEDSNQKRSILSNWGLGFGFGINEFRGDIKQEGFLKEVNLNYTFNIYLKRKVNDLFSISSEVFFGKLNGEKYNDSYLISNTQATEVYDPYELYEESGELFMAEFFEIDIIAIINLESALKHYYKSYLDNNHFDVCYNIGFGFSSFNSIKRNIYSGNYIYGYGFNDLVQDYETPKGFFERPKTRILSYGYTITYNATENINISFALLGKLTDTDLLDSSIMYQQNDKVRDILLRLEYVF